MQENLLLRAMWMIGRLLATADIPAFVYWMNRRVVLDDWPVSLNLGPIWAEFQQPKRFWQANTGPRTALYYRVRNDCPLDNMQWRVSSGCLVADV